MVMATVFRPERDWAGSPVENDRLGEITGVILGGGVPREVSGFQGVVSTENMIGIPFRQASGITVQQGDRLEVDGVTYAVCGPRQWGHRSSFRGRPRERYWIEVKAIHGSRE